MIPTETLHEGRMLCSVELATKNDLTQGDMTSSREVVTTVTLPSRT